MRPVTLQELKMRLMRLLRAVGSPKNCWKCDEPVYYVRHVLSDMFTAYDYEGDLHICGKARKDKECTHDTRSTHRR